MKIFLSFLGGVSILYVITDIIAIRYSQITNKNAYRRYPKIIRKYNFTNMNIFLRNDNNEVYK